MSEMSRQPQYTLWECMFACLTASRRALEEVRALARIPGPAGKDGVNGVDGKHGRDGKDGLVGKQGEKGVQGSPGRDGLGFDSIESIDADGEYGFRFVQNGKSIREHRFEKPKDGKNGNDGRSFDVSLGTYKADRNYRALDVVALNGASFAAKRDNPGPCPGEGWQLVAAQGKRGDKGERGERGLKGERGEPGPSVVRMAVNREGLLTLTNSDGSTVDLDLYPLLSRIG